MNNLQKIFLILFPVFGIWFFLFFKDKKNKILCHAFILHSLVIIYFAFSMIFLKLSLWITPYFMEEPIKLILAFNEIISIMGFVVLYYLFSCNLSDKIFKRFIILENLKIYIFK